MIDFRAHASSSAGNLYTVHSGGRVLAIECGLRISHIRKLRNATGWPDWDACLISHSHEDHSCAAHDVRRSGVPVYATVETLQTLGLNFLLPGVHGLEARELKAIPARGGTCAPWYVLPFGTLHDCPGSVGFLVQEPAGEPGASRPPDRLLFATDTAGIVHTFARLTHVAVECNYDMRYLREAPQAKARRVVQNHMGLDRVLEWAALQDMSTVREFHLLHLSAQASDADAFQRAVERQTGVPTYVAPTDERRA